MATGGRASLHPPYSPSAETAIRAEGLGKLFGDHWAVRGVDLHVEPGEVFGLLGPDGAGKTTTIRLLLGLLQPTTGAAWLAGKPVAASARARSAIVNAPAEVARWPHLSGREVLHHIDRLGPEPDLDYRDKVARRLGLDLDVLVGTCSTDTQQKIALTAAFAARTPVLLLDEPTAGLDPLMEQVFRALVAEARQNGRTVFLSSPRLSAVETVCERVGIMYDGTLVEVAGLADLRRLHCVEVDVRLAEPGLDVASLATMPGVERVRWFGGDHLVLRISGPFGPAMRLLADADTAGLVVREPTLAEVFRECYGNQA